MEEFRFILPTEQCVMIDNMRVITDRRPSVAAALLIETNQSAETISAAVVFGTKTSFYREFRRSYGITPMEYRRLYGRYE